jgi:hypothetical protein
MAAASPSALPYVSWSNGTFVTIPADRWPQVYGSLQALKGHAQEYPGLQGFDIYAFVNDAGDVRLHCYSTWDTPEQLEAFGERGYTIQRMLTDVVGIEAEVIRPMEKIF